MTRWQRLVPSRLGVLLSVALALALLFAACRPPRTPRFSHSVHLSGAGCGGPSEPECPTCASCHLPGDDGERTLPSGARCAPCHVDAVTARPSAETPMPHVVRAELRFSHAGHLGLPAIKGQCLGCHAGVVAGGDAVAAGGVTMNDCLACHQRDFDERRCTLCHEQGNLGMLRPHSFLRHDASFIRTHGPRAAADRALCGECHKQQDCDECHDPTQTLRIELRRPDAIERELIHRGDFLTRHAMEAQAEPARCLRCHTPDACEACHSERGVSAGRRDAISPHPPGWIGANTGSRDFHGRAARRDIARCAACHEQGPATNCIQCHRVGGHGGNPHPHGWSSARSEGAGICRYCHER